ncbi:hypothetical protein ACJ72_02592 [Emergomyces africanus]|uniref:Uncharacterized protein n=1 Tax=Emergomyces africanus TaxID=1955775 RepID=A0A1B7P1Z6_9EURO|nr:hypothetical protein ACJ72_02592 [Emergomyces africanus]
MHPSQYPPPTARNTPRKPFQPSPHQNPQDLSVVPHQSKLRTTARNALVPRLHNNPSPPPRRLHRLDSLHPLPRSPIRPPPTPLKSYIPFTSAFSSSSQYHRDSSYPTPRSGGIGDWFRDKWDAVRNRRTARGAYEVPSDPGAGTGGRHRGGAGGTGYGGGGGAYAHDEIWDSRVGEGGYGGAGGQYYEEQELGMPRSGVGSGPYDMGGRAEAGELGAGGAGARVVPTVSTTTVDLHAGEPEQEVERGRSRSREPSFDGQSGVGTLRENPFADEAEPSRLRDVSPRPEVGGEGPDAAADGDGAAIAAGKRGRSPDRRSAFREGL